MGHGSISEKSKWEGFGDHSDRRNMEKATINKGLCLKATLVYNVLWQILRKYVELPSKTKNFGITHKCVNR